MLAVGGLVGVGAEFVAKVETEWVGPEGWVDYGDVFFGDGLRVIFVFFIEAFFKGVIHSVDGGLAIFVALKSVEIRFLDKENNKK